MGMAASQARYLALSARKTNCEYEGQQINQQRLTLSNQSADLFNQMLTMSVPMPPSSTDYTKLQYSWSDGNFTSVIDNYYQIGTPNEEFNYIVSSYHYESVYTGQRKYLSDPQIQASKTNHFSNLITAHFTVDSLIYNPDKDTYTFNLEKINGDKFTSVYTLATQNSDKDVAELLDYIYAARIKENVTDSTKFTENADGSITYGGVIYKYLDPTEEANATKLSELKKSYGALYDSTKKYYISNDGLSYFCKDDYDALKITLGGSVIIRNKDTEIYYTDGSRYITVSDLKNIKIGDSDKNILTTKKATNTPEFSDYTFVGNCALTSISEQEYEDDITIDAEIQQLLRDMKGSDGDEVSYTRLKACFDDDGNYINGSLYMFKMDGKIYYTTADDLDYSLLSAYSESAVASNGIDSQQSKLSYYNAIYLDQKVSETKKALLETDGQGRFSTVKFEDDSVVYTLNVETIKDDDAYNDAMNKYYYDKEQYDKQIADINSKTEILQAQDRQLQLKLEQLNTEQSALQTEMEACQKVVSKNIENGFKTFGG